MFILGGNAAGLLNKKESFLRNISIFKPAAYLIQESKVSQKNRVEVADYVIFEHIRKTGGGGGVLTAVHKALNPINIGDDVEGEEIVAVEATFGDRKLRLINGYGPQETETEEIKKKFFTRLDLEIKRAKMAGSLICRHGKSRKHASTDCGQIFRKLWTFLDKQQIFDRCTHKWPKFCITYPQLT